MIAGNPLERYPRLNNVWMGFKHRVAHWRERRRADLAREATVGRPRNVAVVVIDCLRPDHVSGFGHDRPTTPTLDGLDAAAFPTATTPSPWTFPAVPSLLSGVYPRNHGGRFERDPRNLSDEEFPTRPRDDVPMLPDALCAAGYDTALVTAIPMAERATGVRFDHVDVGYAAAADRVDAALDWLDGRDRWFCHLHLGDPHAPLDIPEEHRTTFGVPDPETLPPGIDGDDLADWAFREPAEAEREPEALEAYRDARLRAYDAAVRGADDAIGRFLDRVPDGTVVVVCGDHGEAFWEHPDLERRLNDDPRGFYATDHGHSVLEETTRVPLWIRTPGNDGLNAETYEGRVSLVDVAPTVLDAVGGRVAGFDPDGEVLSAGGGEDGGDGGGPAAGSRTILAEETAYGYNQTAVWRGDLKLVTVPGRDEAVAFDLSADPGEERPLAEVPASLREAAEQFGEGVYGDDRMAVDDDTRDRLSELGYLE
jgi:arylsulfatase A-like enzyme